MSLKGRITTIIIWFLLSAASLYGLNNLESNFSKELFIPDGSPTKEYFDILWKYYDYGFNAGMYTWNPDKDFTSEEV